ncbi:maltose alpha-D-glucosyltransferase domain protein [Mycobacterium kansasii]|uniref:Maltose alpha-D-glucosyltransferase domain protein n=1 Tax=Mycobacterium kansasii TaxID=1768 RepID=A0A1V3W9G3_MYCKA|nr:maltose alpha-D-glucosyltransferase domain protein [Mycobacterium kansasii]
MREQPLRFPQPIELNLQQWNSYTPIELTGHVEFPRIGHLPYLLTLPGHGFYWFQLSRPRRMHDPRRRRCEAKRRGAAHMSLPAKLPWSEWLPQQRWYAAHATVRAEVTWSSR